MPADDNLPLSRALTSTPYGVITGRSSPMRHSGRRISWALGGGNLTSSARGATASSALGPAGASLWVKGAAAILSGCCSQTRLLKRRAGCGGRLSRYLLRLLPAKRPYRQPQDNRRKHDRACQPQGVPITGCLSDGIGRALGVGKLKPAPYRAAPCRTIESSLPGFPLRFDSFLKGGLSFWVTLPLRVPPRAPGAIRL